MNHLLCSRCGAVVAHLNALLGHYQEVHGGVPKPWTWTELIGDDAYMECVRAVRREMPRPEPDPDDPHSDADWEPYTALLGFRRMGEAILARAEEVRQEWYEPEEEAIDDVGQN